MRTADGRRSAGSACMCAFSSRTASRCTGGLQRVCNKQCIPHTPSAEGRVDSRVWEPSAQGEEDGTPRRSRAAQAFKHTVSMACCGNERFARRCWLINCRAKSRRASPLALSVRPHWYADCMLASPSTLPPACGSGACHLAMGGV